MCNETIVSGCVADRNLNSKEIGILTAKQNHVYYSLVYIVHVCIKGSSECGGV